MSNNHILYNLLYFNSNNDLESTSMNELTTIPSNKRAKNFSKELMMLLYITVEN